MSSYVYTLAYQNGTVFYVGKGSGDRVQSHFYEASGSRTSVSRVATVIRQIWQRGEKVVVRKPITDVDDIFALQMEKHYITLHKSEHLVNQDWHATHKNQYRPPKKITS